MEIIKQFAFSKYLFTIFIVVACSVFPACDPSDFEAHFVIVSGTSGQPAGAGMMRCSEDSIVWDPTNTHTVTDSSLQHVDYYYDRFVAVGSAMGIYYSVDGQSWTRANSPGSCLLSSVAGGEPNIPSQPWVAYYVAVGVFGDIYFSNDGGSNWTLAADSSTNQDLVSVAFGTVVINGLSVSRFVAVGLTAASHSDPGPKVSPDNIVWSQDGGNIWFDASSGAPFYDLWGVAHGNSRFIAVGVYGTIVYSDNGAGWTAAVPATDVGPNLMGVAYGNGKWVATGGTGVVWYSLTNGSSWQEGNAPAIAANFGIRDVVFAANKFVAIGYNISGEGLVLDSSDGINWSLVTTFPASQYWLSGIAYKSD